MKNTGEQFIPNISSFRLKEEHISRYAFAKKYCKDKVVLDMACGTGYGSFEIAKVAKSVVGADISSRALKYAMNNYSAANINFLKNDCSKLNLGDKKFDVIISFETIEHLEYQDRKNFLQACKKSLKSNGICIISTPNKKITSPYTKKPLNKHHVLEFSRKTLNEEISFFSTSKWFGQRFIFSFLTWKLIRKFIRLIEIMSGINFKVYDELTSSKVSKWTSKMYQPRILIVVLKK